MSDKNFQDFSEFVKSQAKEDGSYPESIGDVASSYITEANVKDVIELLAKIGGAANRVFWKKINEAPDSNDGWRDLIFTGGGISSDPQTQQQMRNRLQRVVGIVRKTKYYQHIGKLFH